MKDSESTRASRYLPDFLSADRQPTIQIKPLRDTGVILVQTLSSKFRPSRQDL